MCCRAIVPRLWIVNRRLRNALCWCWFVYCLLFAGRSAEAIHHAALIFPPLLSLRCFERFALSTFFVSLSYTLARFLITPRPGCTSGSVRLHVTCYDAPAGASALGGCPLCALLVLAGIRLRLLGNVFLSSRLLTAGMVIFTTLRNASFSAEANFSDARQAAITWLAPKQPVVRPGRPGRPFALCCADAWNTLPGKGWIV